MRYIDTHCHLNFKRFNDDADKVILEDLANGIGMIIVGTNYKTSKRAVDLANKYEEGVFAAVGLHPVHLEDETEADDNGRVMVRGRAEEFNYEAYDKLAGMQKVAAIGEIGLDYYHLKLTGDLSAKKRKQKEVLAEQLLLAARSGLPAIIHCRNAHDDLYGVLRDFRSEHKDLMADGRPWGVVHCFSGGEDLAWKYFDLGLLISFTGIITFSGQWDELIRKAPMEKMMIETDSPFMTPEPYRGRRNEPTLVPLVAKRIAEIKGISMDEAASATAENAKRLFGI